MDDAGRSEPRELGKQRGSIELFRIAGIPIRVDYSWALIFLLVLWSLSAGYLPRFAPDLSALTYVLAGLVATLLFFASILTHELAHSLIARRFGIPVPSITLFVFGGVSQMEEEPPSPGVEARIALAGPATSLGLAVLFGVAYYLSAPFVRLIQTIFFYLAGINFALGVFNLLPGFPLDGGRVLRAYLWRRRGSFKSATRTAADAGKGLALGIIILGGLQIFAGALVGGLWLILIGLFLRSMAESEYRGEITRGILETQRVSDCMTAHPVVVAEGTSAAELIDDYVIPTGHRAFPVVRGQEPTGLITIDSIREIAPDQRPTTSVGDRMHVFDESIGIGPRASLADALRQMQKQGSSQLLVVDDRRLVGLLTAHDLARSVRVHEMFPDTSRSETPTS